MHHNWCHKDSCVAIDKRSVCVTLLKNIWLHTLSHLKNIKPSRYLCFACQNKSVIMYASTEEEKLHATGAYMKNIRKAQREREFYNECMRKCKASIETSNIVPGANSSDISDIHYIFDFSHLISSYLHTPFFLSRSALYISLHQRKYSVWYIWYSITK